MWPLPALLRMPTPLPTLASILQTLITSSTTAVTDAPIQHLSPEAHEGSAPAIDKVSPAESEDIQMRYDSLLSFPQREEDPEEMKQPPPYNDLDRMEIDDTSQVPSAESPLGCHIEIETFPHDTQFTQKNDLDHMEIDDAPLAPQSPLGGHAEIETFQPEASSTQANDPSPALTLTLPSPAPPGLRTDAREDEDMAPPSEKRSRPSAPNPTSRRPNHSRPRTSHSQGRNLGKKAVHSKVRQHGTGPLLKGSAFEEMKEVVMRDLTKEYVCTAFMYKILFKKLIHV